MQTSIHCMLRRQVDDLLAFSKEVKLQYPAGMPCFVGGQSDGRAGRSARCAPRPGDVFRLLQCLGVLATAPRLSALICTGYAASDPSGR